MCMTGYCIASGFRQKMRNKATRQRRFSVVCLPVCTSIFEHNIQEYTKLYSHEIYFLKQDICLATHSFKGSLRNLVINNKNPYEIKCIFQKK